MVSSWDTGHSGFGKPIPWHFPFIKFLELGWRRENKSGCSLVSVFFHICFFFMLLWLAEWGFSHMFPPATILHRLLLFFLLTLNRHKGGICWVCLPSEVVRNERLLRHGKVFITLHITRSHLLMEISASLHFSKKHDYNFKNASLISPPNTLGFVLVLKHSVMYSMCTTMRLFIFIEQNWWAGLNKAMQFPFLICNSLRWFFIQ